MNEVNNTEQGLIKMEKETADNAADFATDVKAQAQEYGQKFQEAAMKAKDYAAEKFTQVSAKIKELDGKDPQELLEDAKNYARKKPAEALLVSAAVGLVLGLLLKGRR